MRKRDIISLLALGAIWGGSFIFMRVITPVLGPVVTACFRVLVAGSIFLIYLKLNRIPLNWRENGRHFFVVAIISAAFPFLMFAFAALYIPASLSAIMNSSVPLFGAVFAAIWLNDKLTVQRIIGLILGMIGVTLVAIKGALTFGSLGSLAITGCLLAAISYGFVGIYVKKFLPRVQPLVITGSAEFIAGFILLPFIPLSPIRAPIETNIVLNFLCLSLICTGFAYYLFYKLLADIGPVKASTVTFLMPIFGMIWAAIFLKEVITVQMITGVGLVICGTTLVLYKRKDQAVIPVKSNI